MAYTTRLLYEPLRSVDSSTLSGSYVALGAPLAHSCSIIKLVNNSNQLLTISVDGVTDHDVAPANSFWLYDNTTNSPNGNQPVFDQEGTQYYISGSSGSGLIYLVVKYVLLSA